MAKQRSTSIRYLAEVGGENVNMADVEEPVWTDLAHTLSHDPRPVVVSIDEVLGNRLAVKLKIPVSVPVYALPQLSLPNHCEAKGQKIQSSVGDAHVLEASYVCQRALAGSQLGIEFANNNPGLATLFQIRLSTGEKHTHILQPGEHQWMVPEHAERIIAF